MVVVVLGMIDSHEGFVFNIIKFEYNNKSWDDALPGGAEKQKGPNRSLGLFWNLERETRLALGA
jgi:hypothetical protein